MAKGIVREPIQRERPTHVISQFSVRLPQDGILHWWLVNHLKANPRLSRNALVIRLLEDYRDTVEIETRG